MEFVFNGQTYLTGKLSAFAQLHLSRRLAPFVAGLVGVAESDLKIKTDANGEVSHEGNLQKGLAPLLEAFAGMKDEDMEYIVNTCLDVARRKNTGGNTGLAPIRQNGVAVIELPLPAMLAIAYHTIRENMTDFFAALPSLPGMEGLVQKLRG